MWQADGFTSLTRAAIVLANLSNRSTVTDFKGPDDSARASKVVVGKDYEKYLSGSD